MDITTLSIAKKYTDESIEGTSGVLSGKNCTISSTEKITGATRITFSWTADDGTSKTTTVDIPDGEQGVSIASCRLNASNNLIITLSDGTVLDPIYLPIPEIATEFEDEPSDTKVPSEKLTKDSLDAKLDVENPRASGTAAFNEATATGTSAFAANFGTASGDYSFIACGGNASGICAFSCGGTASGACSFAEGNGNTASGYASHAEGSNTQATGSDSHTCGTGTRAYSDSQFVFGKYNTEDSEGKYIAIAGNGTATRASKRSNAYTLDWSGNGVYAGDVTATKSDGTTVSMLATLATLNTYTIDTGITLETRGGIGKLHMEMVSITPTTLGWTTIATLPDECAAPTSDTVVYGTKDLGTNQFIMIKLTTAKEIQVYITDIATTSFDVIDLIYFYAI